MSYSRQPVLKSAPSVESTFITANKFFVTAESGGGREVPCNRPSAPGPGPWEVWRVVPLDDTHVSIQAHNGDYLSAEINGEVFANRQEVGPWETWAYEVRHDGVTFRSNHGGYLCAEGGGGEGSILVADRDSVGEWELFQPSASWWEPPTPPNPNRLTGPLTRSGRVFSDNSGPRILMFCHYMEAFSAWCHGRQEEVTAQCRVIAEHYAGIRVLDVLGYWDQNRPGEAPWVSWKDKEVTPIPFVSYSGRHIPATPNYWEQKRQFVEMLKSLGLRIMDDRGDMNAWTNDDKLQHMRNNGRFYTDHFGENAEVLAGLWACNEPWQNGGNDKYLLVDMLQAFQDEAGWLPAVRGLGSPGGDSDPDALAECNPPMTTWEPEMPDSFIYWSSDPATVLTVHGNRGSYEHIIEHYFGYGYDETMRATGKVAYNTEPVGGGQGVSVGQVNDVELLCGLTVAALLGGQCWTFMSGAGVFWTAPIETMPGFAEVPRLTTFLPQDIASWPTVCHAGTRFHGTRIMAAVDPTRFDCAIAEDGRFVAVCHTWDETPQALPCERPCSEFTAINMVTGEVERTGPMNYGDKYTHGGSARLIVGRLA